jgi:hypothetical protein
MEALKHPGTPQNGPDRGSPGGSGARPGPRGSREFQCGHGRAADLDCLITDRDFTTKVPGRVQTSVQLRPLLRSDRAVRREESGRGSGGWIRMVLPNSQPET